MKEQKLSIEKREYSLPSVEENYKSGKWAIPIYQRGYVWSEDRRTKLLDSMLKGYPLGSILIWNHKNKQYILDGQQRTRSILRIREFPFQNLSEKTLADILNVKYEVSNALMLKRLIKYFAFLTREELSKVPFDNDSVDKIKNILEKHEKDLEFLGVDIKEASKALNIFIFNLNNPDGYKIHSIEINNASEKDAIHIFNRLNVQGIPLTKFEILSSKWSPYTIKIRNAKFKEIIKRLYSKHSEKIGIDNELRETLPGQMTPSEVLYSIVLNSIQNSNIYRSVFTNDKGLLEETHLDKWIWVFRVLAYSKGKTKEITDDKEADEKLGKIIQTNFVEEDLVEVMKFINKAVTLIEKKLPLLSVKTTSNKYIFAGFSKNMLISLLVQTFLKLWDGKKLLEKEWKTAHWNIIKDIIDNRWASSTNVSMMTTIKNFEYFNQEGSLNEKTIETLIDFKEEQQRKSIDRQRGFNDLVKFVISFAYAKHTKVKVYDFDYDHIVPHKYLENEKTSYGRNSIGNCGLLEASENRSKQATFNYEDFALDKLVKVSPKLKTEKQKAEYKDLMKLVAKNTNNDNVEILYKYRYEIIRDLFIESIMPE